MRFPLAGLWLTLLWPILPIPAMAEGRVVASEVKFRSGLAQDPLTGGNLTGVLYTTYPGGEVRTESFYEDGAFTGVTRHYDKNGRLEKILRDPSLKKKTPPQKRQESRSAPVGPHHVPKAQQGLGPSNGPTGGSFLIQGEGSPMRPQPSPGGGGGFLVSTNGEAIPIDLQPRPGKLTVVVDPPSHGRLKEEEEGRFTYYPDPDYRGLDTFRVIPAPPGNPEGKIDVYVRTRPIDAETDILILTDMSGSMDQTWPVLNHVQNNQLRRALVRFYGSVDKYHERVRLLNDPSERTLVFLQPSFAGRGIGKKITLVFQDEAHPHYHRASGIYACEDGDRYVQAKPDPLDLLAGGGLFSPLVAMAEKDSFMEDITELRRQLAAQKDGFYRGVLFQIDNPVVPGFHAFVETVFEGRSPYTNSRLNLKEYTQGKFPVLKAVYGVSGRADADTYFEMIRSALAELGVVIPPR